MAKMKIAIISLACCNPALAVYDQQYMSEIKEALAKTGVDAQVEVIPASNAFLGLKLNYVSKLMPLFNKYGMAVAPVMFINGELVLYGGVPSVEKIVKAIEKAKHQTGKRGN